MSFGGIDPELQADLSQLSQSEKLELVQSVTQESQKATLQENIHQLTDRCFKKCITSPISSGKLSGMENTCMTNCVGRFMDSSKVIIGHLDKIRSNGLS